MPNTSHPTTQEALNPYKNLTTPGAYYYNLPQKYQFNFINKLCKTIKIFGRHVQFIHISDLSIWLFIQIPISLSLFISFGTLSKNFLSIQLILTVSPTHLKDSYYLIIEHIYLLVSSANNLCKRIGHRSGLTIHRVWSGSNLFDTHMVFLKNFFEKVGFEKNQQTTKKVWKISYQYN